MGHSVLSPREREKKDRRDSRNERQGQGRKGKMNESEETVEITFPSILTCCKDSRYCPAVSQYQTHYNARYSYNVYQNLAKVLKYSENHCQAQ